MSKEKRNKQTKTRTTNAHKQEQQTGANKNNKRAQTRTTNGRKQRTTNGVSIHSQGDQTSISTANKLATCQFRRLPKSPYTSAVGLRLVLREYCVGGRGVVLALLQPPTHRQIVRDIFDSVPGGV